MCVMVFRQGENGPLTSASQCFKDCSLARSSTSCSSLLDNVIILAVRMSVDCYKSGLRRIVKADQG